MPIHNTNPNARRWAVHSDNEMLPLGNISWRMAAMYCNFLYNGGATGVVTPRENFLNGAYDVSMFGPNGMSGFGDQPTRSPGARYCIPTRDEWIKAAHYDPHRHGQDKGGYWLFSNSTDSWIPGGPGPKPNGPLARANCGSDQFTSPGYGSPFTVPPGAFPDVQSPWGLLDVSGATTEWTEDIRTSSSGSLFRIMKGCDWSGAPGEGIGDAVWMRGADWTPNITALDFGLRIASVVPAPSSLMGILGWVVLVTQRRCRG